MTYEEYISQFEILENPPIKEGFYRHHIVPKSQQTEVDERQVYMTLPQHMWAHILYDRENGTNTAKRFLNTCGKDESFFSCFSDCLGFSDILEDKEKTRIERAKETMSTEKFRQDESIRTMGKGNGFYGKHHTEEWKKEASEKNLGENNPMYGKTGEQAPCYGRVGEKHPMFGQHHTEDARKRISDGHMGEKNHAYGKHWFTNGVNNVFTFDCPEGYRPGMTRKRKSA